MMLTAIAMAMVPLGAMLAPASANAATTAACTGGVALTQFAFSPASVPAGSSSQLTLVLQNCTNQAITGSTDWYGYYLDANGNEDCGVIDPVAFNFSIAAGGTYTLTNTYGSPPGGQCQPAALEIGTTVNAPNNPSVTSASAFLQFAPACSGGVTLNQFSFNPVTVNDGQTSPATLVLKNCTSQAITGITIWSGQYTAFAGETLPGCPVIDALAIPYSIAPGGTATLTEQEGDTIPECQANGLKSTVNVNVNGVTGTVATATAALSIVQPVSPPSYCHVTYSPNQWGGGFTANVTINNTMSSTTINNWTLTFVFPGDQKITSAWNATVSQTGENVSATNESYNATIPPGGSQSFGFQGTWTSSDASPLVFFVNGTVCN
jgi:hypothetical protein